MPPKKTPALSKEESTAHDSATRDGRLKRGANFREAQDESPPAQPVGPSFDIGSLPLESLRKYRKVMHLSLPSDRATPSDNADAAPKRYRRVEKEEELAAAVKKHWSTTQCKESEVITSFMYSIKNQDKTFKLRFVETSRN